MGTQGIMVSGALLCSVGFVALVAQSARADCDFDMPGKNVKSAKFSLVRMYEECAEGTGNSPNTASSLNIPGCTPPSPLSAFKFADSSSGCQVKMNHKVEEPCEEGGGEPCANLTISASCKGVLDSGDVPTNLPGFSLNTVLRVTLNDATLNGVPYDQDMTLVDLPIEWSFPQAENGVIAVKENLNHWFEFVLGPGGHFSPCTSIELISATVLDPSGNPFAGRGSSSR